MARVSICIPSYKPKHFRICLTSAISQTFSDTEIIVSDDCKTEEIKEICDLYPDRVKYSRNPNPGTRSNFIRAMSLAEGEYVKLLLDDDLLHPFCVQYLCEAMEIGRQRDVRLAYSPRATINSNNEITGLVNIANVTGPGLSFMHGHKAIATLASNCTNFIGEFSTVMFRREDVTLEDGRPLIDLPGIESLGLLDAQAWINLAERGNIAVHPETLSYFRQHEGSNSDPLSNPNYRFVITEWEDIVNYANERGYFDARLLERALERLVQIYSAWAPQMPQVAERLPILQERLAASRSH